MSDSMRVTEHPILGTDAGRETVTIYYEDRPITARAGVYCAMGRCTDCMMIVDGEPNVRTCITPVRDGMRVQVQHGLQ